jgi:hypothetical protein
VSEGRHRYFVSYYHGTDDGALTFGSATVDTTGEVRSYADVEALVDLIMQRFGYHHRPIPLFYQHMGQVEHPGRWPLAHGDLPDGPTQLAHGIQAFDPDAPPPQ